MNEIAERRAQRERRQRNDGPPSGCADRRLDQERRLPRAERAAPPVDEVVTAQIAERRTLRERRQRNSGPPLGCSDRRRELERRLPAVEEHAISDAEWQLYFGAIV